MPMSSSLARVALFSLLLAAPAVFGADDLKQASQKIDAAVHRLGQEAKKAGKAVNGAVEKGAEGVRKVIHASPAKPQDGAGSK
jgi:hypothetical protein